MFQAFLYGICFACKGYRIAMLEVILEVVGFSGGVGEGNGEVGLDTKVY
jgi:hypothetical protein